MKDGDNTKAQLADDLAQLRQRVAKLEAAGSGRKRRGHLSPSSGGRSSRHAPWRFLLDAKGKVARRNQAMTKLLRKPFDELIGRTSWELVHGTSLTPQGCPSVEAWTWRCVRRRYALLSPVDFLGTATSVVPRSVRLGARARRSGAPLILTASAHQLLCTTRRNLSRLPALSQGPLHAASPTRYSYHGSNAPRVNVELKPDSWGNSMSDGSKAFNSKHCPVGKGGESNDGKK